ncbi:MAG TPA: PD-(D/E)XK nuclease family protein [Streptosporangiaceae bacterium]|nr:PD-(D/E)XK nuclease family protein [Streptosporangiaceae bacterium]
MEQLGFEGMPHRLYPCTPTRLSTWLDCPRRYRMSYLDRPAPQKGAPWAHNSLGASVHNALAAWWRLRRRERTVATAGDLLRAGWITEGFANDSQSLAHRERCRQMVESYVATLDPGAEPAGVERTVATRTDLIAVSGRIDRLDDRRPVHPSPGSWQAGELVVVDYKTGRHELTVDDARTSMAMALYALAAERVMRRSCRRVELHHLPTGKVLGWQHSQDSLARQLRRAEDIAAECAAADEAYKSAADQGDAADQVFKPAPGPGCSWCDFRAHCPEGRAASQQRKSWDGLSAADDEPGKGVSPPEFGAAPDNGVASAITQ